MAEPGQPFQHIPGRPIMLPVPDGGDSHIFIDEAEARLNRRVELLGEIGRKRLKNKSIPFSSCNNFL
jgi:hypothetical protein